MDILFFSFSPPPRSSCFSLVYWFVCLFFCQQDCEEKNNNYWLSFHETLWNGAAWANLILELIRITRQLHKLSFTFAERVWFGFREQRRWSGEPGSERREGDIQYPWNGWTTPPGVCVSVPVCVFYSLWNEDGGAKAMQGEGMGSWDNQPPINSNTYPHTHTHCLSWAWDNRVKGPRARGSEVRAPAHREHMEGIKRLWVP